MDRSLVLVRHSFAKGFVPNLGLALLCGVLVVPGAATAQVVTPKTLPVHQSGQFDIFPSARAGMGGATIAVDDTLLDPFVNPAKTTRMGVAHIFASPFYHSISGSRGGGRSLPVGGGGSWGEWSATGVFTFQQLDRAGPAWNLSTSEQSAVNEYVAGSIARRLSPNTSFGVGVQAPSLHALSGV